MAVAEDQQYCLRWNNFQANIMSQFETLRDNEDFTDVTIACDGKKFQAHKMVLSACSPFFKELFKTNPCSHPIIFMRDVEAQHIVALLEFMYAGEVNVAQAQLPEFLKTAESLKIRGLTDTAHKVAASAVVGNGGGEKGENSKQKVEDTLFLIPEKQPASNNKQSKTSKPQASSSTSTSSQDLPPPPPLPPPQPFHASSTSPPPPKRQCKSDSELPRLKQQFRENAAVNPFALQAENRELRGEMNKNAPPKMEFPEYLSDEDGKEDHLLNFYPPGDIGELPGGMEIIPQMTNYGLKDGNQDTSNMQTPIRFRKRRSNHWLQYDSHRQNNDSFEESSDIPVRLRDRRDGEKRNRLIKLGEGIEIYEDQLRSVKWNDYRKLTRGLATILFSPAELATCSVTGQRWSRAGSGERPVKPALDRSKVQAIISYVATRFPMVEISRIKQVLAYKCKENSTAFKMKAGAAS